MNYFKKIGTKKGLFILLTLINIYFLAFELPIYFLDRAKYDKHTEIIYNAKLCSLTSNEYRLHYKWIMENGEPIHASDYLQILTESLKKKHDFANFKVWMREFPKLERSVDDFVVKRKGFYDYTEYEKHYLMVFYSAVIFQNDEVIDAIIEEESPLWLKNCCKRYKEDSSFLYKSFSTSNFNKENYNNAILAEITFFSLRNLGMEAEAKQFQKELGEEFVWLLSYPN